MFVLNRISRIVGISNAFAAPWFGISRTSRIARISGAFVFPWFGISRINRVVVISNAFLVPCFGINRSSRIVGISNACVAMAPSRDLSISGVWALLCRGLQTIGYLFITSKGLRHHEGGGGYHIILFSWNVCMYRHICKHTVYIELCMYTHNIACRCYL